MFYSVRRNFSHRRFAWQTRQILHTAAMRCDPTSAIAIVSQTCKRDLHMYLLAVKSFMRFVPVARITAVDDLSLDDATKACLRQHLPNIDFVSLDTVPTGRCPRGGTWERLSTVVQQSASRYVVQVDSDTLTLREPRKVLACVASETSFTQGTYMGRTVEPILEFAAAAKNRMSSMQDHVQLVSEAHLDRLRAAEDLRYVRGCSGFAGFARGAATFEAMESFSTQIEELIGAAKWHEWGSEQVASNFLVANSPQAEILAVKDYGYYHEETDLKNSRFIHFIGSNRFTTGTYARLARKVIEELRASA